MNFGVHVSFQSMSFYFIPDIYPGQTPVHGYQNTQIRMFTEKLFYTIIGQNWKQFKYPYTVQ